jgi:hypothetical protein
LPQSGNCLCPPLFAGLSAGINSFPETEHNNPSSNERSTGLTLHDLTAARLANQTRMSRCASFIRDVESMKQLHGELIGQLTDFFENNRVSSREALPYLYKSYDILLTQTSVLSSMIYSAETQGSHGGALVTNASAASISDNEIITHRGATLLPYNASINNNEIITLRDASQLPYAASINDNEIITHRGASQIPYAASINDNENEIITHRGAALLPYAANINNSEIITNNVIITHNGVSHLQPVRPLPSPDEWFENVWERYVLRQQLH